MTLREPIEIGGARGFRYAELPPRVVEGVPAWLESGVVEGAEEVRAGRLYKLDGLAVKLFGRKSKLRFRDRLNLSPAVRYADLHAKLKPIRSPKPLLAIDRRRGGKRRTSVLVYEWIEGRFLTDLWGEDDAAVAAFPSFVAQMHNHGAYHGDLHVHNMVWDGEHWYLIDLDGLRHRLRNLLPVRLAEDHWARVGFGITFHCGANEADARGLFEAYVAESRVVDDADAAWPRVMQRLESHREAWLRWVERG